MNLNYINIFLLFIFLSCNKDKPMLSYLKIRVEKTSRGEYEKYKLHEEIILDSLGKTFYEKSANYANNDTSWYRLEKGEVGVTRNPFLPIDPSDEYAPYGNKKIYDKDSLVTQELGIDEDNTTIIAKYSFHYNKNKRLIRKEWLKYPCCIRTQPIFDREEYFYDNKGKLILHCKICDKTVKRAYKPKRVDWSLCKCIMYKFEQDTLKEEIRFTNSDIVGLNLETIDDIDSKLKYYYTKIDSLSLPNVKHK